MMRLGWGRVDALLAVVLAASLCAGCLGPGTTRLPQYYILTAVATEQARVPVQATMGLMPARLPGYLDRPALVERRGAEIIPLPLSAWAAPLDEEFSRVLAQNLSRALPGCEILHFPWSRSAQPEYRLHVEVEQFEREGAEAVLRARWRVVAAGTRVTSTTGAAALRVPVTGSGEQAYVTALSAALGLFSTELARSLRNDARLSFGVPAGSG